jgi:hypothetical protein
VAGEFFGPLHQTTLGHCSFRSSLIRAATCSLVYSRLALSMIGSFSHAGLSETMVVAKLAALLLTSAYTTSLAVRYHWREDNSGNFSLVLWLCYQMLKYTFRTRVTNQLHVSDVRCLKEFPSRSPHLVVYSRDELPRSLWFLFCVWKSLRSRFCSQTFPTPKNPLIKGTTQGTAQILDANTW